MRTVLRATCLALLLAGGCARHTEPVVPQAPLSPAEQNFESLWQASLRTLQRYHFTVDRTDRRAGVIETFPMTSQQWFEAWRKDASSGRDLIEGSLQGVTRQARVKIVPEQGSPATRPAAATEPASPQRYSLTVQVIVARPSGQISITETVDGYDMFILPGREERSRRYMLHRGRLEEEAPAEEEAPGRRIAEDRALADRIARDIERVVGEELAKLQ